MAPLPFGSVALQIEPLGLGLQFTAYARETDMTTKTLRLLTGLALCALVAVVVGLGSDIALGVATTDFGRKFTVEQHVSLLREAQLANHPKWKDLSWPARARKALKIIAAALQPSAAAAPITPANFQGNLTAITGPDGGFTVLLRQPDCSLEYVAGGLAITLSPSPSVTNTVTAVSAHYEQVLHTQAALTTTSNVYAHGCTQATAGLGSRRNFFLGATPQKLLISAFQGYDPVTGTNALYSLTVDPATNLITHFNTDTSDPNISSVVAGDLNGDGLADIVRIDGNALGSATSAATINVSILKSDGTFNPNVTYTMPGSSAEAAVIADVNGDGKLDVVVASVDSAQQETLSVLTGNGDGTLNAPQSVVLPSAVRAAGSAASVLTTHLIAVDLRGTGHVDLVDSNGMVLFNDGSGVFTAATSPAFEPQVAVSEFAPNVVAGDFNNDGKPDLAVNNGAVVSIFVGNGDGTFVAGARYANTDNVGYMSASDLDGDGNTDLVVGSGNNGVFGGDQYYYNKQYVLMGLGDGTFAGAPAQPFVYSGNNLADVTRDGVIDAIGVNPDLSFTAYLGDGKGGFTAKSTLVTNPVTVGGISYTISGIDSYAIGDVNGDGNPDLLYIAPILNQPAGVFVALGDGNGGFAAPVFQQAASFLAAGDIDINPAIANLRLADFNHDGKVDLIYGYSVASHLQNDYEAGTAVQLGLGNGTFHNPQVSRYYAGSSQFYPTSKVALTADLNKDGNVDLILLTQTSTLDQTLSTYVTNIQVALGKGDGTFATAATVAGPDLMRQMLGTTQYAPLAVADMNGDGNLDIVALGASASTYKLQLAVSLGVGDGTFKTPLTQIYTAQALSGVGMAIGDFNADGKPDVVLTDPYDVSYSGIAYGNGDGTLQVTSSTDAFGTSTTRPMFGITLLVGGPTAALDLNGDGKADVFSGNVELLSQASVIGTVPTGDFSITANSAAGTIASGQSTNAILTLTPSNGFDQSVALTCSGLPAGASCAFAPASLTVNSSVATSTLTISTSAATALNYLAPDATLPTVLAAIFIPFCTGRRRRLAAGFLTLVCLSTVLLHGCGGDSIQTTISSGSGSSSGSSSSGGSTGGTPAGTYNVTIMATGGSISHTLNYILTVS